MTRIVLLDDGTQLAADIGRYLRSRGYPLEQHGVESFLYTQIPIPTATDILIFCNGEHYGPLVSRFAQPLREWVRGGGALLATPWAAWSASNLLPLAVRSFGRYREGAQMTWNWRGAGVDAPSTPFTVSYEEIEPLPDSTTLLNSTAGVPIVVSKAVGDGLSVYLNATSHSCTTGEITDLWASVAPAFALALRAVATWRGERG